MWWEKKNKHRDTYKKRLTNNNLELLPYCWIFENIKEKLNKHFYWWLINIYKYCYFIRVINLKVVIQSTTNPFSGFYIIACSTIPHYLYKSHVMLLFQYRNTGKNKWVSSCTTSVSIPSSLGSNMSLTWERIISFKWKVRIRHVVIQMKW